MKVFKIFLLLIVITSNVFATETVTVQVQGMVCQMCVFGMRKSFEDYVDNPDKHVNVNLDNKTVILNLNKKLTDEQIKLKIKDAGYNAGKITYSSKANIENDKK
jgi:copper chaperone CopZ